MNKVQKLYHFWSKIYNPTLPIWNFLFARKAEREFMKLIQKTIKPYSDILDVGVGTGNNIKRLLKLGIPFSSYEGVDLTPEMLKVAKKHYASIKNVQLREGDIMQIKLEKKYDVIISTWVFSHLKQHDKIVDKLLSGLKNDGHLILLFLSERQTGSFFQRFMGGILRLFATKNVSLSNLEKFPTADIEKHYRWIGGNVSIYIFSAKRNQ